MDQRQAGWGARRRQAQAQRAAARTLVTLVTPRVRTPLSAAARDGPATRTRSRHQARGRSQSPSSSGSGQRSPKRRVLSGGFEALEGVTDMDVTAEEMATQRAAETAAANQDAAQGASGSGR